MMLKAKAGLLLIFLMTFFSGMKGQGIPNPESFDDVKVKMKGPARQEYPVVKGLPDKLIQQEFNKFLRENFTGQFSEDDETGYQVLFLGRGILTMGEFYSYDYWQDGGRRGSAFQMYSFDLSDGTLLTYEDVLQPGSADSVLKKVFEDDNLGPAFCDGDSTGGVWNHLETVTVTSGGVNFLTDCTTGIGYTLSSSVYFCAWFRDIKQWLADPGLFEAGEKFSPKK